MKPFVGAFGLVLSVLVAGCQATSGGETGPAAIEASAPTTDADTSPTQSFTGRVDDLDFIANLDWCQVILFDGQEQLVAITREPRMQSLLELGFSTGLHVDVDYREGQPNVLTRVKVNRESTP
jgi:hypothetical protein